MKIEQLIQDPENAEMYYCPRLSTKNCRCIEEFVMKHSWTNENLGSPEDALKLLKGLRREAVELSKERCIRNKVNKRKVNKRKVNKRKVNDGRSKSRVFINRKSKKYIKYIFETRRKLRLHGICEVAAKKILKYSNNVIYRKLKYDYDDRNDLIADEKSNMKRNKKLLPIEELIKVVCCKNKCTNKLKNDVTYYSKLRSDAITSQKTKRKAITKLLMTLPGEIPNCNKFIIFLLGVSRTTMSSMKNFLGLGSKRAKKQESEQTDEKPTAYTQNLETTMPFQTSNTHQQTTDAVNNFQQVYPIPEDMGQSFASFQNTEVPTTQTQMFYPVNSFAEFDANGYSLFDPEQFQATDLTNQNISKQVNHIPQDIDQSFASFQNTEVPTTQIQMFYPVNSFAEFDANGYSLFNPEQFQTTDLTNQNISMQGCPNVSNVSHQFYVQNEGVTSASHNPNINYIGYTEQNCGNNIMPTYNNNLPLQQYISVNPINQYLVNDFSYQYLPTYPANVNRMYTINPSPLLYWNGIPVTTHTPSSFG